MILTYRIEGVDEDFEIATGADLISRLANASRRSVPPTPLNTKFELAMVVRGSVRRGFLKMLNWLPLLLVGDCGV